MEEKKGTWGLYVPKIGKNPEHWLIVVPGYFTYRCLMHKNFNNVEWMPSSYADPYDCPLGPVGDVSVECRRCYD